MPKIVDKKGLKAYVPYSSVHISRLERLPDPTKRFPQRVVLSPNGKGRCGWVVEEVEAWVKARMSERKPLTIEEE